MTADDSAAVGGTVRAEASEASEASETIEPSEESAGAAPADEPGPNGALPHAPSAAPDAAETEQDDRPVPAATSALFGPSPSDGPGENVRDARDARDGGGDQADLAGAPDPRVAGRVAPDPATKEGSPAPAHGSDPSAERAPSEGPASDPRPRGSEAPGRLDDVPPAKAMRVESGTPADPAPATPPSSLGALASRDVTAEPLPEPDGTAQAPDTSMNSGAPEAHEPSGEPEVPEVPETPLPPVPLDPGHRSSEADRTAFRALADRDWDRHGAAVARSLARVPALRGKEQEAARADLIALRMYLHTPEGPLSHGAVSRALREYEPGLLPYAACVASALNRLPSHRGAVLRGMGSDPAADGSGALPRPGTLLRDAALLSTVRLDPSAPAGLPGGSYVIWSVAGRRVRQLTDHSRGPEEVVFAPGTLFRVLDVRREGPSVQIFLRELTGPATANAPDPEADRAVLARLDDAVRGRSAAPASTGHWPERCVGAVGAGP